MEPTFKHVSILIALAIIIAAVAWDVLVIAFHADDCSWCQAWRDLNQQSDGLVALGVIALWIHIFLLPLLPSWWR